MLQGIGKGGYPVVEGMESNHWVALDIGKNGHAVFIAKPLNFRVADFFQQALGMRRVNNMFGIQWLLFFLFQDMTQTSLIFHSSTTMC